MSTSSLTIKVTGVPQDLVALLDDRVKRRHAAGRSEYVRELIRKDVLGDNFSVRETLAPYRVGTSAVPDNEAELDAFFNEVRDEVYKEKRNKK